MTDATITRLLPPQREQRPMTLDDLSDEERWQLAKLRAMPREYRAAWTRMALRLVNGVSTARAEALLWREIAVIDARATD